MVTIARSQLRRIRSAIQDIAFFLARMLDKDIILADSQARRWTVTDQSDQYYAIIAIWYIVRHICKDRGNKKLQQLLLKLNGSQLDDAKYTALNQGKLPLLRWYYYGSILGLQQQGFLHKFEQDKLTRQVHMHRRDAMVARSARLVSKVPYSAEDEIVDRLAFLASELGLEKAEIETGSEAGTMASLAIRHVKRREFPRYINPGWLPAQEDGYISGPWELHALCHNSRLNVLALETHDTEDWRASAQKAEEVELYKEKLYRFLNSEATLVSCWERSHIEVRKGWLRSEATAVLGSTLLDIHSALAPSATAATTEQQQRELKATRKMTAQQGWKGQAVDQVARIRMGQRKAVEEAVHTRHLAQRQLEILEKTDKAGPAQPIDWAAFAPERQYHPDDFVQSLEDTPHQFRPPFTDALAVPDALCDVAPRPTEDGFDRKFVVEAPKSAAESVSISDIIAVCFASQEEGGGVVQRRSEQSIAGTIKHVLEDPKDDLVRAFYDCVSCFHFHYPSEYEVGHTSSTLAKKPLCQLVDQIVQHRFL
jgi:hypothetical protein